MELTGRDIVCLASSNWDAMWVNAQHLMNRLSADNRILYINNLGLRAPGKAKGDWLKVFRRLGEWFRGAAAVRKNLWVLSPVNIPLHRWRVVRAFNRVVLRRSIRRQMRRLGFRRPLLWTFLPLGVELIGALNEAFVIYHCVDDYAFNPGVAEKQLREMERRLLAQADLVLTTNPLLYEERQPLARYIQFVGNVAHTPHFEPSDARQAPARLAELPRPILGYQGNISGYKTDLELLAQLAQAMPEASVVLGGPEGWGDPATDLSALKELPNVHFIGRVTYTELPAYVGAFDVGLLPLRINDSTKRSFPMKFYEYMAAGKPIVATALPAFAEYRDHPHLCRLAADADSFIAAVRETLADPTDHVAERMAEARRHSWDIRAKEIRALVARHLAEKESAT